MQTLSPVSIDYQKDTLPPIANGKITINGGRAVIWEWRSDLRKYVQVDIITKAIAQERGGKMTVGGRSSLLAEDTGFGGDESLVNVTATLIPGGCQGCR